MFIITIYVLLAEDIRLSTAPKSMDDLFTVMNIVCLFLFTLEIIISTIGYPNYPLSMFFWLDIISTASIITDIEPWMDFLL